MPDVFEWFELVFTLVTIPLSLALIYALVGEVLRSKSADNSFYRICLVETVIDIASLTNNNLVYAFPKWGWCVEFCLRHEPTILYPSLFVSWGLGTCQFSLVLLMAFNRFTALMKRDLHAKLWTRSGTYAMICVACTISLVPGFLVTTSPLTYVVNQGPVITLTPKVNDITLVLYLTTSLGIVTLTGAMFIIAIYTSIFLELRRLTRQSVTYTYRRVQEREKRILQVSVIVCSLQLLVTFYLVTNAVFTYDDNLNLYNFINTIYSGINSYTLFGFSSTLRDRVKRRALGSVVETSIRKPSHKTKVTSSY